MSKYNFEQLRQAAEIHHTVQSTIADFVKVNRKVYDLCQHIENSIISLGGKLAFPCGVSINQIAAHYTAELNDKTVIKDNDLIKIDYGVHVDGNIIDSAFTICLKPDEQKQQLMSSSQEALEAALKLTGPDARLSEIGQTIEEVIKSYNFKSVRNLSGHSIDRYRVHAGQTVANIATNTEQRMLVDQCYAIEPYSSAGRGIVVEQGPCNFYRLSCLGRDPLIKVINQQFGYLPFCRRWLENYYPRHLLKLKKLVSDGYLEEYPPLVDTDLVAQFEKTIYINENGTVIL